MESLAFYAAVAVAVTASAVYLSVHWRETGTRRRAREVAGVSLVAGLAWPVVVVGLAQLGILIWWRAHRLRHLPDGDLPAVVVEFPYASDRKDA